MKKILSLLAVAAVASLSLTAMAQTPPAAQWEASHPARTEVNARLAHQDARINAERKEGKISTQRAKNLHKQDRRIRKEERKMAKRDHNHGHLNKHQVRKLNHQENRVSHNITK